MRFLCLFHAARRSSAAALAVLAFAVLSVVSERAEAQTPAPPPKDPATTPAAPAVAPTASAGTPAAPVGTPAAPVGTPAAPGGTAAAPAGTAAAPGTITLEPRYKKRTSRYITWDANIDGALGYSFEGDGHLSGFGRVRGGLLFVNEEDIQAPAFRALGLTYEFSDFTPATFGLQFEFMSLNSGAWLQAGAMVDIQPRPGFMLAAGLSLVGVEGQVRWSEGDGAFIAIFGKLRIPLGIIGVALRD